MNTPRYKVVTIPEQARVIDTHKTVYSALGDAIYQGRTKDAKEWAAMLEAQERHESTTN